jgi:broad specificity phosphatase PhoE
MILVRHGQASINGTDYDVLSPLGAEQSRLVGAHLAATGRRFDALVCGPRRRHQGTAQALAETAGDAVPTIVVYETLDELPFREIVLNCLQGWTDTDEELRAIVAAADVARLQVEFASGRLRPAVAGALKRWVAGTLAGKDIETFASFSARVTVALERAARTHRSPLIVTSGGPIGIAVAQALGLEAPDGLRRGLRFFNASITEIVDGQLLAENTVPHLAESQRTIL